MVFDADALAVRVGLHHHVGIDDGQAGELDHQVDDHVVDLERIRIVGDVQPGRLDVLDGPPDAHPVVALPVGPRQVGALVEHRHVEIGEVVLDPGHHRSGAVELVCTMFHRTIRVC